MRQFGVASRAAGIGMVLYVNKLSEMATGMDLEEKVAEYDAIPSFHSRPPAYLGPSRPPGSKEDHPNIPSQLL